MSAPFQDAPFQDTGCRLTPNRPWERLTDAEWAALRPFLADRTTAGRKLSDERARMEAFFWVAAGNRPWKDLPEHFGKPDSVSRHFRRLAHAGLWQLLLRALALPGQREKLATLAPWIVRCFRRATKLMGAIEAIRLARGLGFLSALRGPPVYQPHPDLSEFYRGIIDDQIALYRDRMTQAPKGLFGGLGRLLGFAGGRTRPPRWAAWAA